MEESLATQMKKISDAYIKPDIDLIKDKIKEEAIQGNYKLLVNLKKYTKEARQIIIEYFTEEYFEMEVKGDSLTLEWSDP